MDYANNFTNMYILNSSLFSTLKNPERIRHDSQSFIVITNINYPRLHQNLLTFQKISNGIKINLILSL